MGQSCRGMFASSSSQRRPGDKFAHISHADATDDIITGLQEVVMQKTMKRRQCGVEIEQFMEQFREAQREGNPTTFAPLIHQRRILDQRLLLSQSELAISTQTLNLVLESHTAKPDEQFVSVLKQAHEYLEQAGTAIRTEDHVHRLDDMKKLMDELGSDRDGLFNCLREGNNNDADLINAEVGDADPVVNGWDNYKDPAVVTYKRKEVPVEEDAVPVPVVRAKLPTLDAKSLRVTPALRVKEPEEMYV